MPVERENRRDTGGGRVRQGSNSKEDSEKEEEDVKAQVRDLRNNSGNLCPSYIIRHMLTKWTDHPPGICGWGVKMALKGLGIRKCVSSRISLMYVYHSMYFHYLLLFVIHVLLLDKLGNLLMYLSLSVTSCISAEPL